MRPDLPCNEPRIYADAYGVDHVFVNGVQIIRDGKHTNARPGTALRSGKDTYTPVMMKPVERRGRMSPLALLAL